MKINRDLIKLARQARGYSQKELASKLEIKQGTYSKIENDILDLDEGIIDKLVPILKYPKSFFLQNREVHMVKGHYRRKLSLPQKKINIYQARMTMIEWNVEKLMESLDFSKPELPKWDCTKEGDPIACAQFVRELWRMPKGVIPNLSNLLENKGVIIIPMDLGPIDAFSAFSDSGLPLIFINNNLKGDRFRFNLAHEFGHLVMHFGQKVGEDRDIEDEAHNFGSEFLMPALEIKPHLKNLNLKKLEHLKSYWLVSMQAIVVKAYKQLEIISKNQYHYLFKKMAIKGYLKNEPGFIPLEKPNLFNSMISLHLKDLDYSENELLRILHLTKEEFQNYYLNQPQKGLRIA